MRVPEYNGRIQEAGLPSVRISPNAPDGAFDGGSAQLSKEIGATSRALVGYVQQETNLADDLRLSEERRAFNDWERVNVDDMKTGVAGKLGKDAFGVYEPTMQAFDKFSSERRRGLATEQQRKAFDLSVAQRREHISDKVTHHQNVQTFRAEDSEIDATIKNSIDTAVSDPNNAKAENDVLKRAINRRAQLQGWGDQEKAAESLKWSSELHKNVIQRFLVDQNDEAAVAYLEQNKTEIDPKDYRAIEQEVQRLSVLGKSQRAAAEFTKPIPVPQEVEGILKGKAFYFKEPSEEEALAKADKMPDGEAKKRTKELIRQQYSDQRRADEERYKARFQAATDFLEAGGDITQIPTIGMKLQDINRLKATAKRVKTGEPTETDWRLYSDLMDMSADVEYRQKFINMDLYEHKEKLSDADFKELKRLQISLRNGEEKAFQRADGFRTTKEIVTSTVKGKVAKGKQEAVMRLVDDKVKRYQMYNKGQNPPDSEVQKYVDDVIIRGKKTLFWVDELWPDSFEMDEEGKAINKISPDEMRQIISGLRASGQQVDDAAVIKTHIENMKKATNAGK